MENYIDGFRNGFAKAENKQRQLQSWQNLWCSKNIKNYILVLC